MPCKQNVFNTTLTASIISAWSPVILDTVIPFDLESTPLQIKTNSTVGSGDRIAVGTYTADGSIIGRVGMLFTSPVKYGIGYCTSWTTLPVQPPEEVEKTWTIQKTATILSMECNGVEVLNYQFSKSGESRCVPHWGGDVVEKIKFDSEYDTASDNYRAMPTGNEGVLITVTKIS